MTIFKEKHRPPDVPFQHSDNCKILEADPGVDIQWSEIRSGYWEAVCQCGKQWWQDPTADDRVRLDPRDPTTARHLGQCEYASETDPAALRFVLKVKEGADRGLLVGRMWFL